MALTKNNILKITLLCAAVLVSAGYILLTKSFLPLSGNVNGLMLAADIVFPIVLTVSAALLMFTHNKMSNKLCLFITAAVDIVIGLKYAYVSIAFSSTDWLGISDVSAAVPACIGIHIAYSAMIFAVSTLIWRGILNSRLMKE